MDFQQLNQQVNDAVNRFIQAATLYFSNLNQMEIYGWSAFGIGFVVFIVGIVLL